MKLEKIYKLGLIKDNTEIFIRQGEEFHILTHGNWYQDNILNYMHHEIESFTWQDDNKIYVDIKEQNMSKLTVKDIINLYGDTVKEIKTYNNAKQVTTKHFLQIEPAAFALSDEPDVLKIYIDKKSIPD